MWRRLRKQVDDRLSSVKVEGPIGQMDDSSESQPAFEQLEEDELYFSLFAAQSRHEPVPKERLWRGITATMDACAQRPKPRRPTWRRKAIWWAAPLTAAAGLVCAVLIWPETGIRYKGSSLHQPEQEGELIVVPMRNEKGRMTAVDGRAQTLMFVATLKRPAFLGLFVLEKHDRVILAYRSPAPEMPAPNQPLGHPGDIVAYEPAPGEEVQALLLVADELRSLHEVSLSKILDLSRRRIERFEGMLILHAEYVP